jgi:hypothetical protein
MVAIDPGGTTGYCQAQYDGKTLAMIIGQERFTGGSLYNFLNECSALAHSRDAKFYVIYEKFHYRNKARPGLDLTAPKLIGVMDLFIEETGALGFAQMPAEGKGYWTDDQLKRFQVYVKGLPHGRDAQRHLLQWWQFKFGYGIHQISPFTNYTVVGQK